MRWTAKDESILQKYYPEQGASIWLQKRLKRSASSLRKRAFVLNIKIGYKMIRSKHHSFGGYGEMPGTVFCHIRRAAKTRGLKITITQKYMWNLFLKQNRKCALSGLPIDFSIVAGNSDGTASLDRINSKKGYVYGNVQWVHKDINFMKQDHIDQNFISLCKQVAAFNSVPKNESKFYGKTPVEYVNL